MKKYVLKATALAIGALVGGGAVAAVTTVVDFDAATPTVNAYAKELNYTDANPLAPALAANGMNFTTKIGFGVSNGQTRYIRVDYANATLDAAHGAANTDIDLPGGASVALVQGGAIGNSYVIYQITATADLPASSAVNVAVPNLRVTSTAAPVAVTYSLHETAVSAVAGTSGSGLLYSKTQNVATFSAGLKFALTTNSNTASVEKSFKEFTGAISATTAKLGNIEFTVNSVKKRDGTAVALSDLVQATTKIDLAGDFTAAAGADAAAKLNSVYISTDANCGGVGIASTSQNAALTTASFTVNTTAITGPAKGVCYVVTGGNSGAQIPSGTYTAGLTVTAASTTATADVAPATLGTITRDGTELIAPFATIHPDYVSRVFLSSQHTIDATVTATATTDDGSVCAAGVTLPSLKAGKQLEYKMTDICPSISGTGNATRMSVRFTIAAPKSKISGAYNQYLKAISGAAAGAYGSKTSDMNNYVLVAPAN